MKRFVRVRWFASGFSCWFSQTQKCFYPVAKVPFLRHCVILSFICFVCNTNINEISDMEIPWAKLRDKDNASTWTKNYWNFKQESTKGYVVYFWWTFFSFKNLLISIYFLNFVAEHHWQRCYYFTCNKCAILQIV